MSGERLEIVWQDPPSTARTQTVAIEVARYVIVLKERPGQWALVHQSTGRSGHSRRRELFKDAGCDVAGTTAGELYARWPS